MKIGKHEIELYDGAIGDLPMERFHKLNKLLLAEAGIGADTEAADARLFRLQKLIKTDPDAALKEAQLLRQCIAFAVDSISPQSLAFAVLVKSIDGKPVEDISDAALKARAEMLGKASRMEIAGAVGEVKKKPKTSWKATLRRALTTLKQKLGTQF